MYNKKMLQIKNISAQTESNNDLLKDISMDVQAGEIHAILGPKHSGKTALLHMITGHPGIDITEGTLIYKNKKIHNLTPDKRSKLGIFISMQYPPEYDGITNLEVIQEIFESRDLPLSNLKVKYNKACEEIGLGLYHGERQPNGTQMLLSEAKQNELVHMLLLDPDLVLIDEVDDGLSEQELEAVGNTLKNFLSGKKSAIIITHSKSLLDIVEPTHVHVMVEGAIKVSGDKELYSRIVEDGYSEFS